MKLTRANLPWLFWWTLWVGWWVGLPLFFVGALAVLGARALAPALGWPLAVIVAGVPALLVAGLILRSALRIVLHDHFRVRRAPAEVFRFMATDYFQNRLRWYVPGPDNGRIVEFEQTTPGPVAVGTIGRLVVARQDQQSAWTLVVTAYEPNRRFAVEERAATTRAVTRYTFAPLAGGTEVTVTYELHYKARAGGWLWAPLTRASLQRLRRAGIQRMQEVIEADTSGPDPALTATAY